MSLFKEESGRLWNWNRIGLGALGVAAVGAAGVGAALLARKTGSADDDFELRLETDENVRLISSKKVEGTPVVGTNGETLGRIESFMVDKYTGRVAYAIMSFGGTLGVGASYFPVPWPLLDYDVDKDGYALDITKEQLAGAPKFEANSEPEFSPEYRRQILVHYRP
ncbi:MAG TPA: PRC-barrel domain-containing protein [Allosphingosinicella sp.]|nr:PRC-barrel domain-containing protein [Allosphingosinicella sp.]